MFYLHVELSKTDAEYIKCTLMVSRVIRKVFELCTQTNTNTNTIRIININEYEYYSEKIFQRIRIRILFVNVTIRII